MTARVAVFDLDGTLVDSDAALQAPFAALGVDPATIPLGLPLGEACALAGVRVEAYLAAYDHSTVQPFPGVVELLGQLDRWAVCSNKAKVSACAELARLGWSPVVAMFSEDFEGQPKELAPVLAALGLEPDDVLFVGDTAHDRTSAVLAPIGRSANFGRGEGDPHDLRAAVLRRVHRVLLHDQREATETPLFATQGLPKGLSSSQFQTNTLQRAVAGQSGAQWFCQASGRAFCLYVVLGAHRDRWRLATEASHVVQTITVA